MVVQHGFSSTSVSVFVLSPSTQSERRFASSTTIAEMKAKLESVTGIPAASQKLSLQDGAANASSYNLAEGSTLAVLSNDMATLADYGVTQDGYIIKVDSSDQGANATLHRFVEDANVQKFELTPEEYAKRNDTVMAYKARNKIGRFADQRDTSEAALPAGLQTGARVKVDLSASATYVRLGTVRFVGETLFAKGTWVGVEYDEPVGGNDGSVENERYFTCRMKYGGFVKPDKCQVGDFPKDTSLDDEDGTNTDEELGL